MYCQFCQREFEPDEKTYHELVAPLFVTKKDGTGETELRLNFNVTDVDNPDEPKPAQLCEFCVYTIFRNWINHLNNEMGKQIELKLKEIIQILANEPDHAN